MAETAAERFARDWAQVLDTRRRRGLEYQDPDRTAREYVAPNGTTPADNDNKFGTPYTDE